MRLNLGDNYGALQDFNNLLKSDLAPCEALRDRFNGNFLLYRGRAYFRLQQYEAAFEDYNRAWKI